MVRSQRESMGDTLPATEVGRWRGIGVVKESKKFEEVGMCIMQGSGWGMGGCVTVSVRLHKQPSKACGINI
jgi:hypothetical protein